ncbi:MerR family transcriptional regulator [Acetobacter cerevisiae]|uniref:Helix-turn-helix domain-containing protein n=2 Tax=Acetobacter TaxID=434 RepID=A0A087PXG2_9PROT|nr:MULTISPECIES: hypothetical protein [Acetobacter]KFL92065.1 hypothetical protein AmDm5_0506 [Acetobacter malorum]KXV71391.1 hypothetical protein AD952_09195 [Acetobacter cerevisiae]MCP1271248.1 hypothetical protein [Acetobacter cerevisiae]MCP1279202.1 hypothetical protein [Acetobacter cerevisiae]OAG78507.1 hypothetical protein Amal_00520 [Acetobacter malorum]
MGETLAPVQKRTMNVKEAAEYIGVSPTNFRMNIAPSITPVRVSPGRIVYLLQDLDAYLDRLSGKTAQASGPTGWEQFT